MAAAARSKVRRLLRSCCEQVLPGVRAAASGKAELSMYQLGSFLSSSGTVKFSGRIQRWHDGTPLPLGVALALRGPGTALRLPQGLFGLPRAGRPTHSAAIVPTVRGVGAALALRAASTLAAQTPAANAATSAASTLRRTLQCYYELSKTRLSLLVVATAAAGFVVGSSETVDWASCAWTSFGTFLSAASANSFNQIREVRMDAAMKRTMRRPLPSGRISKTHAIVWAWSTGAAGVTALLMGPPQLSSTAANNDEAPSAYHGIMPAALAACNIGLYALVYTSMKRLHPVNTWVGAVVGAIPPLIGWTAAAQENNLLSASGAAGAWIWAAVLYFWQLPHFLSLAWMCREDYARGGYKMLSVIDKTGHRTAGAALRNCAYLVPMGALSYQCPVPSAPALPHSLELLLRPVVMVLQLSLYCGLGAVGVTTWPFAVEATLLSAAFVATAVPFYTHPSSASARKLFRMSLLFLPAYIAAMTLHRIPNVQGSKQPARLREADHSSLMACPRDEALTAGEPREKRDESQHSGQRLEQQRSRKYALPPAAYASAAPFPFLPLPQGF